MGYENIRLERDGHAAIVTLNRPKRRNPLSLAMLTDLTSCFRALGGDRPARRDPPRQRPCLLRRSRHRRDGREGRRLHRQIFEACTALMETIPGIPQPVIAQVHGIATAAGCQLVASCDLAVAAEEARFATPGVRIGLFCATPMVALSRAVGSRRAMEMLLTGEAISAQEALAAGLVNRVVPPPSLPRRPLAGGEDRDVEPLRALSARPPYRQIQMPQPSRTTTRRTSCR
jgi:enoyl-CoA hydratase/carnithine racemase